MKLPATNKLVKVLPLPVEWFTKNLYLSDNGCTDILTDNWYGANIDYMLFVFIST